MAVFDLTGIGKSPARFDVKKLLALSGQHLAVADNAALLHELAEFRRVTGQPALSDLQQDRLARALPSLKTHAKTLPELFDKAQFLLIERPVRPDEKALAALDGDGRAVLAALTPQLQNADWTRDTLERIVGDLATARATALGKLAGPLRAALAGRTVTPSVFDMMLVLGRDETIARLTDAAE